MCVFCSIIIKFVFAGRLGIIPMNLGLMCVGEYPHRARTASAPRQVFEQLPWEMVYRERGCKWYLVASEALPFPLIGSG